MLFEADPTSFSLVEARPDQGRGKVKRQLWLSRDTLEPLRSRAYDARGELQVEVSFGGWTDGTPRVV